MMGFRCVCVDACMRCVYDGFQVCVCMRCVYDGFQVCVC